MKVNYYLNNDINCYDYLNMQIMDRTRGLGWTLGKVIGRTLGREVSGDADESPRRRRPTTSAHRQREVASFVEDVEHVDHVVDEVHKQLEKATAEDVDADAQDFPDRPHDTSILMDYIHHVAVTVWNREVFIFLNK